MDQSCNILIECKDLSKYFGPTRALIDVKFSLREGEVCGLIGENGSGKSTLASIIAGVKPADSGDLIYESVPYKPANMLQAQQRGVAMIVQEAATLPSVSVAENIFVGNLKKFTKSGIINRKRMIHEANKILQEIGANDITADMRTNSLNFEDRKIVEIARAIYLNPKVLIVDGAPYHETRALGQ